MGRDQRSSGKTLTDRLVTMDRDWAWISLLSGWTHNHVSTMNNTGSQHFWLGLGFWCHKYLATLKTLFIYCYFLMNAFLETNDNWGLPFLLIHFQFFFHFYYFCFHILIFQNPIDEHLPSIRPLCFLFIRVNSPHAVLNYRRGSEGRRFIVRSSVRINSTILL